MKLINNNERLAVLNAAIGTDTNRYTLAQTPADIGESVRLETDTGMALRTDAVQDWLRHYLDGGTLVLTNLPEPVPEPVPEPPAPTLEEVRAGKLAELNDACTAAIAAGCDVTLSDGSAGHISLTIPDQINLTNAQGAVLAGKTGYAYHLDGELCRVYDAADIEALAGAATGHVLYHQTYCNHARAWAKRAGAEEIGTIAYGAPLPEDLAAHMAAVLSEAAGETEEAK